MAGGILAWFPHRSTLRQHIPEPFLETRSLTVVPELGHRPALDGLRGLALVLVLLTHTAPPVVAGGFIALEIFFVMSAFLITTLLLEEHQSTGRVDLRRFYLRRVLRLVPALLTLLAGVWIITLLGGKRGDIHRLSCDSATILCYCHNWRLVCAGSWREFTFQLCPCWSLAVEEQFYLTWPIILALLLSFRVRRRWILAVVLPWILVPPVLRPMLWKGPASFQTLYFATYSRADGIALGCLLGLLRCWWPIRPGVRGPLALDVGAWLAVAVLLYYLFTKTMFDACMYQGGFEVVNLASVVLVAALLRPPPFLKTIFQGRILRWLGRISYGAYLWNQFFFCLVLYETPFLVTPVEIKEFHTPVWLRPPLIWAGTLLAGAVSWYAIERPFLRLKDRLSPPSPSEKA
jgi:peptidoglycan/LPS O-acetylase OafA/YrhL